MRIKEANGISVWLSVDGDKLGEQRMRKTGDEDDHVRMECFVCPKPHQEFTINVHLGRQRPWKGDWIAEPIVNGHKIHSLHVRKRWHVTHKLSTFYEEDEDGELVESTLSFGYIADPDDGDEPVEGDQSRDAEEGMIVVELSRGEIERVRPTKRRISQRVNVREGIDNRGDLPSGTSHKAQQKTAYGEEFTYDEGDGERPYLRFVFKSQKYCRDRFETLEFAHQTINAVPAQQHPSQVSRTVRLKADPDEIIENELSSSIRTASAYHARPKREPSEELVETESAKRLRLAEEEIKSLKVGCVFIPERRADI
ncbi:hypothetical protein I204_03811 [Kwoniella mangroviensis CBS 8886]|nr:uncharacterized protein I203_02955 [Kwoniella mangroviensis CBS 8507]OCF68288.1 hypothetical protein I203_02955 [Kwoniella mangroviensis CBS 8507]OCF74964.1 hypothetical protein I204_03811 [Kwoniella mangroviensis CBS 8886]